MKRPGMDEIQRNMRRGILISGLVIGLAVFLCCSLVIECYACRGLVREVGFISLPQEPYRVYFFVQDNTLAKIFESVSKEILEGSNVEAKAINPVLEKTHPALKYLRSLGLKKTPVMILVSPQNEAIVLAVSDFSKESIRQQLESVVSSSAREEIKRHIAKNWCVVVFVEGRNPFFEENERAEKKINKAIQQITEEIKQIEETKQEGPYFLRISKKQEQGEKVLLWSMGLLKQRDQPGVLVLFGLGRQIGPAFYGEEIDEEQLLEIFYVLGANCACSTSPELFLGPQIPFRQEDEFREEMCKELGFDPESPEVKFSFPIVGWLYDTLQMSRQAPIEPVEPAPTKKGETMTVKLLAKTVRDTKLEISRAPLGEPARTLSTKSRIGRALSITIAVMAIVIALITTILLLRKRSLK